MYGCGVLICLSGGFHNAAILFSKIEVQSWLGIFISWCLHMFISRLMVVISANSILDSMCCFFCLDILLSIENFLWHLWLGWSIFSIGANVFARCWYSCCSLLCMQ